jgi:hypothetical protein
MTQFHEGQEVEVTRRDPSIPNWNWRNAKIAQRRVGKGTYCNYMVEFPDGTSAVFDAAHIRALGNDTGLPDYAL